MKITSHVLDISKGKPAQNLSVMIELKISETEWRLLTSATTNADGRTPDLTAGETKASAGIYRLTFETSPYFKAEGVKAFYPFIQIVFEAGNSSENYHVPLLLSPYGYSTYRGS